MARLECRVAPDERLRHTLGIGTRQAHDAQSRMAVWRATATIVSSVENISA
jgi:hypothetical protein